MRYSVRDLKDIKDPSARRIRIAEDDYIARGIVRTLQILYEEVRIKIPTEERKKQ
jgi:hypothetical protein